MLVIERRSFVRYVKRCCFRLPLGDAADVMAGVIAAVVARRRVVHVR